MRISIFLCLLGLVAFTKVNAESNADLHNTNVERTIDLTSHLAYITNKITVENKASSGSFKSYTFTVEPSKSNNIAHVGAQLPDEKGSTNEKNQLKVTQISQDDKGTFYRIDFRNELAPGKSLTFEVQVVLFNLLKPYPAEITQAEKQYVIYADNHYYYSLYATDKQKTTVTLSSDKIESYSQLKPTSKSDSTITYGPYESAKPFQQSEMSIHFENNSPFLTVSKMTRTIEISHWGNIAVEETIDMYHSGAQLVGPFSRFDYMRKQGGSASVKSFRTLLPSMAADVYYRDEIGNISTSNLRVPRKSQSSASAELELRPRFPLFGGWKTHYTVGYNVPVYQYLYTKGEDYLLKMKLVDHVCDDQFIEDLTIKIILPEHSTNLDFVAPYTVTRRPNDVHHTYLDTVGRPVIVINKKNVVENHIQDFQVRYKFQKIMVFKEPLLVVGFFYLLFTFVIIIVRLDFSLSSKAKEHIKKE